MTSSNTHPDYSPQNVSIQIKKLSNKIIPPVRSFSTFQKKQGVREVQELQIAIDRNGHGRMTGLPASP
jgi:hypothetical protein